jgi:hypothetical protein
MSTGKHLDQEEGTCMETSGKSVGYRMVDRYLTDPAPTQAPPADQAATNEQVGGCDHPGTERNQR